MKKLIFIISRKNIKLLYKMTFFRESDSCPGKKKIAREVPFYKREFKDTTRLLAPLGIDFDYPNDGFCRFNHRFERKHTHFAIGIVPSGETI